ncbi:hypothetical protein GJU40_01165 [Bacillus lacus]|uniref:DUF2564 family protein n=1 Tax=Metabacillus lacus TaxID=1983721 RepID=A0A7X2LX04_9BACI|nr:hypothetical protein [Metabacillus lacus]MRX70776.1 hypothetical protein [Metabacillus lacus]
MKEILQHVKLELEQSFDNPEGHDLDHCISELQEAKKSAGDKQEMFQGIIHAVQHAKHAKQQLIRTGDASATNAFAEAHRAVDQAMHSYESTDNDPL